MHYRAAASSRSFVECAASRAGSAAAGLGVRAGAVLFATALTGAAATLSVAVPWTAVPFTMQPVAVLLAGAVLGARLGAVSQLLYLALGFAGAAMFALSPALAPGAARLAGPTGGFLLAFPVAAFVVGTLADRGRVGRYSGALAAMLAGLGVLYAAGAAWLTLVAGPASTAALWAFAASDLVKVVVAAAALPVAARVFAPRA
ncbi:MAG: biotin transporter BioY [Vicinamibacterales bacterium]